MSEAALIYAMAELWVNSGGDAEGIDWCKNKIKAAIKEIIKEQNMENNDTTG